jgi:two-component system NtrC family sensor kinase
MKLGRKLMYALMAVIITVFAIRALMRVRDEIERYESDARQDHRLIARALRPAVVQVWRAEGKSQALDLLRYADSDFRRTDIRWVSLDQDPVPAGERPRIPLARLGAVLRGEDASFQENRGDDERLTTYVPLSDRGELPGAIEVSESLLAPNRQLRERLLEITLTAGIAALASILVVSGVGVVLVGRPMRRLADKARRIGAGDLSGPLVLAQQDEIGELAREMNHMCERLQQAQDRLTAETAARINALEQLRHADRLSTIGRLASGVAHELGTPLNVVTGHAKRVLTGEATGQAVQDSVRIIYDQGERMTRIIRSLLEFARRPGPHKAPGKLDELGRKTLALLRPLAAKSGVTLEMPDEGESAALVPLDPSQIQQVLMNLVVNGIQAMPRGGTLSLAVGVRSATPPQELGRPAGEHAYVAIRDQGVGIAPADLPRVFEPFYTTKGVGEGTGLGLAVAYGIVRDHGGWIDIASEVGRGSCFTIYLPTTVAAEVAA